MGKKIISQQAQLKSKFLSFIRSAANEGRRVGGNTGFSEAEDAGKGLALM